MNEQKRESLRRLPAIEELIQQIERENGADNLPRSIITEAARTIIHDLRQKILAGEIESIDTNSICSQVIAKAKKAIDSNLRWVINGTGVVLHTNLGRALLSKKAQEAIQRIAGKYSNLELNLASGERGSRYSHVEDLLINLTGAEAALVVNNNAGAVLLALSSLAYGQEVIVSRGQLVEIGGAFRVPDVMTQSGAILTEVGTTNKTYIRDYETAITENTALFLKVHTSNYRVLGFTHETSLTELVELSKVNGIPVMEDIGSGFLFNLREYGIGDEPTVQESIKTGVDVVTFSGDKLLGGPQAGIIVGKKKYIEKMKKHPLTRALRVDKLTLSALEATLIEYLDLDNLVKNNPTLRMLTLNQDELRYRAENIKKKLIAKEPGRINIELAEEFSQVGGGALPTTNLPTTVLRLKSIISSGRWAEKLRKNNPSVMVRVKDDQIIIDPRTILEEEIEELVEALLNSL